MAKRNTNTKAKSGRIQAPRQQSARRSAVDEASAQLKREIAEKVAEGKRLRRQIEVRIDKALREG